MTKALRDIHNLGFLHLDIKPNNILTSYVKDTANGELVKLDGLTKNIFLIDFGCCQEYRMKPKPQEIEQRHRERQFESKVVGCGIFQSYEAMRFLTQSRRDDLISMVYTLVYLANGETKWAFEHIRDEDEQEREIMKFKKKASPAEICQGDSLPLAPILEIIYGLSYDEEPDYDKIVKTFIRQILE